MNTIIVSSLPMKHLLLIIVSRFIRFFETVIKQTILKNICLTSLHMMMIDISNEYSFPLSEVHTTSSFIPHKQHKRNTAYFLVFKMPVSSILLICPIKIEFTFLLTACMQVKKNEFHWK